MNGQAKEKIERTREYVLASNLADEAKDGLGNLLDAGAKAANGAPDKIQAIADALMELILHEVKQAVRYPETFKKAVEAHALTCPLNTPAGKLGVAFRFRWPICVFASVAVFSPNFGRLAELIKGLIR
jgi:hypothetical protein